MFTLQQHICFQLCCPKIGPYSFLGRASLWFGFSKTSIYVSSINEWFEQHYLSYSLRHQALAFTVLCSSHWWAHERKSVKEAHSIKWQAENQSHRCLIKFSSKEEKSNGNVSHLRLTTTIFMVFNSSSLNFIKYAPSTFLSLQMKAQDDWAAIFMRTA